MNSREGDEKVKEGLGGGGRESKRREEEEEKAKGTDGPFKRRADPSEQEEKEERRGQRRAEAGGRSSKGAGLDAVGRGRGRAGGERATARRRCSVSSLGAPVHARYGKRQGTGRVRRPAGGGSSVRSLLRVEGVEGSPWASRLKKPVRPVSKPCRGSQHPVRVSVATLSGGKKQRGGRLVSICRVG